MIVVDACVLLNLYATGRAGEILSSLASSVLVSSLVCAEALWIAAPSGSSDGEVDRDPVVIEPLAHAGIVTIVHLSAKEQKIFLRLAHDLDDGEAASGAIAAARSGAVATDDRKARTVLSKQLPPTAVIGTVAILQTWEASTGATIQEVGIVLRSIRTRARFEPASGDDGAEWWRERVALRESAERRL